ncbi:MAG: hypothetical protein V4472_00175 [Pseudomonadota bacterium]
MLRIVGEIFVQLLDTPVALLFTAIVVPIAALRMLDNAAKPVGPTLVCFALTR